MPSIEQRWERDLSFPRPVSDVRPATSDRGLEGCTVTTEPQEVTGPSSPQSSVAMEAETTEEPGPDSAWVSELPDVVVESWKRTKARNCSHIRCSSGDRVVSEDVEGRGAVETRTGVGMDLEAAGRGGRAGSTGTTAAGTAADEEVADEDGGLAPFPWRERDVFLPATHLPVFVEAGLHLDKDIEIFSWESGGKPDETDVDT